MPRPKPPHLYCERSRHGRKVWYVRKGHGLRTRIESEYGSAEFWSAYQSALAETPPPVKASPKAATLEWAIDLYRNSSAWAALKQSTRAKRESIFTAMIELAGDQPISKITRNTILAGRERRKDKPNVANEYLKAVRGLFKWLADPSGGGLITNNPCIGIKTMKNPNPDGFHTWTDEEIVRFEQRWPIGTRERLALDIMIYTGLARSDVVKLGKSHASNGVFTIRMVKERGDNYVYPPLLKPLAASIAATKTSDISGVYLVTKSGAPFTPAGFSNWFRVACIKAGVPGRAHGLRKAGARRAAENGATTNQLQAYFGWGTEAMPTKYTRKANRKKLAAETAHLLLPAQAENE